MKSLFCLKANNPMNKKIKEAIESANKLINESSIDDPELKKIAFAKAVDYYLQPALINGKSDKEKRGSTNLLKNKKDNGKQNFWDILSEKSGVKSKVLKDVYLLNHTGDNIQITLLLPKLKGATKASQQRYLTALILFAYQEGLNTDWVPALWLAEAARNSKIYDTSKFAKNIKHSELFRTSGNKKGLKYKLSAAGYNKAKEFLDESFNN